MVGDKHASDVGNINQKWLKDITVTSSGLNLYFRQAEQSVAIEKDKIDDLIQLLSRYLDHNI